MTICILTIVELRLLAIDWDVGDKFISNSTVDDALAYRLK
jgi:hypothetical protein